MAVAPAFDHAMADADQALRLDPNNPEAYMVRGTVRSYLYQEVAARADLDRALALAPGNADILNFAGDDYEIVGNLRAAERMKREAMALDPLAFVHPSNLAHILIVQGRFKDAIAQAQRGVELGGENFSRSPMFWAQLRMQELTAAAETAKAICAEISSKDQTLCLIIRLALSAAKGDRSATERLSDQLMAKRPQWMGQQVYPSDVAMVYADFVGDIPKATLAMHDSLVSHDYYTTGVLLFGPNGARLPEEVSRDPEWLAIWNDPKMRETMSAYRSNILAFRQGR